MRKPEKQPKKQEFIITFSEDGKGEFSIKPEQEKPQKSDNPPWLVALAIALLILAGYALVQPKQPVQPPAIERQ